MMDTPYVCAFRGRRDDYQLPLALHEAGCLDQFITDFYAGPLVQTVARCLPARWNERLRFRHKPGLPPERVRCLSRSFATEHLRHWLGYSRASTYAQLDVLYSQAAARRAREVKGHLFLYTPYAWEAFTASYPHHLRRLLFQYHPHAGYEERLLEQDAKEFPEIAHSFAQETGAELPEAQRRRVESCWQHADRILCASTFTRMTLLEAGADPDKCEVIPYGIDQCSLSDCSSAHEPPAGFQALFVGSGIQRKGLHHLLRAWERATLPAESKLTIVCRILDPGLRERIARTPRVHFLPGVSPSQLTTLYRRSSLLTMPSLVEGFGQVYLEALAMGCPVLGTAHTCLPDIGQEEDGVFLVRAGDINHLVHRLEILARELPTRPDLRIQATRIASRFTWAAFRAAIRPALLLPSATAA